MREVKINRLNIRLKGISREAGNSVAHGLGREVLHQLASNNGSRDERRAISISQLDCGTLQAKRDTASSELRGMIASAIARAVNSRTGYREKRG